jgi:hypothetical protein
MQKALEKVQQERAVHPFSARASRPGREPSHTILKFFVALFSVVFV